MRDHGGNLDWAMRRFGGAAEDWVDLSTGINPEAYPVPEVPQRAWAALPTASDMARLTEAARAAYGTGAAILPVAGAQAAIQLLPHIAGPGEVRVLGPTYNEHGAAFEAIGRDAIEVVSLEALRGAAVAVVVNPNNPDGAAHAPEVLRALAGEVGFLVVDESFADPVPELSLAEDVPENAVVLRSFGKFYGLAGVRLGFVLGSGDVVARLRALSGPWPVSGAAIEIGCAAFDDTAWRDRTCGRLAQDAERLDTLATGAGWQVVGGTTLFRLYSVPDAGAAQARLAEGHVWSRVFPYSATWLRLGLPPADRWGQVAAAISG